MKEVSKCTVSLEQSILVKIMDTNDTYITHILLVSVYWGSGIWWHLGQANNAVASE